MITLLLSPSTWIGAAVAVALLAVYNTVWENPGIRATEREIVASEARKRALDLIQQRSEDNEEISTFDQRQLCVELGGRWVQPDTCD